MPTMSVGIPNAEGCVNNFASLFQLTLLQLAELAMELSSALSVPAPSAVEAAATCVHFDIHILSITKNNQGSLVPWKIVF